MTNSSWSDSQRVETFATPFNSARANLDFWNRIASATSPGLAIDGCGDAFRGELGRWRLPNVTLLWPRATRSIVHRRSCPNGEERVLFHLQGSGRSEQKQGNRECLLKFGDLSLCGTAAPSRLKTTQHDMIVIDLPRRLLDAKVNDLEAHMAVRLPSWSPGVDALRQFLVSAWEDGLAAGAAIDGEWLTELDSIIVDLLALAIKGAKRPEARAAPLQRVARIVSARLQDPRLSGTEIALELGVSLRTLQLWLSAVGKTPRSFILEARLVKAAERLRADSGDSVTAIAFELGFNDSAYFSRCFSRRFGCPPALWRKVAEGFPTA